MAEVLKLVDGQPLSEDADKSELRNSLVLNEETSLNQGALDASGVATVEGSILFDASPKRYAKTRPPLGNSASGKNLLPKHLLKQDVPKSVFSSTINLPKLKADESHRRFAEQCKQLKPANMTVPLYRGYVTAEELADASASGLPPIHKKDESDVLVSRYRRANPLREKPHMSWGLHNQLKWSSGRKGKLVIRDLDNPDIVITQREEDEYIRNSISKPDEDDRGYDEENKFFIGENALKEFSIHYKLIEKIESENKAKEVSGSVYTSLLAQTNKKRLLPVKMSVVKRSGDPAHVDIRYALLTSNYKMGNTYSEVLLSSLGKMTVDKLSLRDNNLDGGKVLRDHQELFKNIEEIDFSLNDIGRDIYSLKGCLEDRKSKYAPLTRLRKIGLDKVCLGGLKAIELLSWVETSNTLLSLSLADNKLSDEVADALTKVVTNNLFLQELYLPWNNLTSKTAEPLFKALAKNDSLRVLDLGWNNLGTQMKLQKKNAAAALTAICQCLSSNTALVHLSLCNNDFSEQESKQIAEVSRADPRPSRRTPRSSASTSAATSATRTSWAICAWTAAPSATTKTSSRACASKALRCSTSRTGSTRTTSRRSCRTAAGSAKAGSR